MKHDHLTTTIKQLAKSLGFEKIGITDPDLSAYQVFLMNYLNDQRHGNMHFMEKHIEKRMHPENLLPGAKSIICVTLNYFTAHDHPHISRYAFGHDYHDVVKQKLYQLAEKIKAHAGDFQYRVFTDSAPVLEKALAEKAGLGWIGKNTLLTSQAGSWFFLGELLTNLPLTLDAPIDNHCGNCETCLQSCPTKAFVEPYKIDFKRCIAYLTIEHKGAIPVELRPLIGTRIYGCDICQSACPQNQAATPTSENYFEPKSVFMHKTLLDYFTWDEKTFLKNTENTTIQRIGYERFLRNVAIALGNSSRHPDIISCLKSRLVDTSEMVQTHIKWAIEMQEKA